jgi:hypothetical protein
VNSFFQHIKGMLSGKRTAVAKKLRLTNSQSASTLIDAQVAFDEMQQSAEAVNSIGSGVSSFQLYISKDRNIVRQQQKSHKGGECDTKVIKSIQQDLVQFCISFPLSNCCFMRWVIRWKPPCPLQLRQNISTELRPIPWPSFRAFHEATARWGCSSLLMLPSWLPSAWCYSGYQSDVLGILSRTTNRMAWSTGNPSSGDRVVSLKNYRRVKGLCACCAEKWFSGRKCAATVQQPQLHAMEEVWNLFAEEFVTAPDAESIEAPDDQLFKNLSHSAWLGTETHQTLKLHGSIQQQPLLILLDSISSHTNVNEKLLPVLQGVQTVSHPLKVWVANGILVAYRHQLLQAHWYIQEYEFVSNIMFLPLPYYDMDVDMDWLASFNSMRVAWAKKWLTIPYNGSTVILQGKSQVIRTCTIIELLSLDSSAVSVPHCNWHPRIQSILHQYASVLEDPTGLPPKRECEHSIPLVPGAQPFLVKHYRYPPNLKDEIEQVTDMLQLPTTGAIHTIFHVSSLKRAVGCDSTLIPQLPQLSDPLQVPVTIMQTRLLERGGEFLTQGDMVGHGEGVGELGGC